MKKLLWILIISAVVTSCASTDPIVDLNRCWKIGETHFARCKEVK